MKISVCLATYNGEIYIKEQLDSILKQLKPKDELIISDDGSTDNTIGIINSYKDSRIKIYHSNKKNLILNFQNALEHANGEIIFLSDQDDIWVDDKITKTLPFLINNLLVFSNAIVFNKELNSSNRLLFKKGSKKLEGFKNFYKNNYIGATMAFKAELLNIALPFPSKIPMHDSWLGLMASCLGKTYYITEPLIFYRRHEKNISMTGEKSKYSLGQKLSIRWNLFSKIILRLLKLM